MDMVASSTLSQESQKPSAFRQWLLGPWPFVLFVFLFTLVFNSLNNDLPFYYEKDAHSKVRQVVSGDRNFFHPLLMLNTADVLLTLSGAERTPQHAAVAGRAAIALFTAISAAAFAMLGWRMAGRPGAIAAGALVATYPLLFELSHIFKEDPALVVGLALAFLSMQIFWEKRGRYQAGWMGVAAGIAISGKYVGVVAMVMAMVLLALLWRQAGNRGRWLAFVASLLLTLGFINHQLIANAPSFAFGFKTEMADLTRKDKLDDVPQFRRVRRTLGKMLAPGVALAYGALIVHTAIYRRRDPVRWMLIAYPIIFIGVLLYSPRLFTRHFLPVLVMLNVGAAIGIGAVIREITTRTRLPGWLGLPVATTLVALIIVRDYRKELVNYYSVFANPTREIFIQEAIYKLPPDAVIASDSRVYLVDRDGRPREHLPVEQKVIVASRIAAFGSLERLRELGVTHVAVHGIDSRYLFKRGEDKPNSEGEPSPGEPKKVSRKKRKKKYDPAIYDEIRKEAKLIYRIRGRGSAYNAPALRLYELPKE